MILLVIFIVVGCRVMKNRQHTDSTVEDIESKSIRTYQTKKTSVFDSMWPNFILLMSLIGGSLVGPASHFMPPKSTLLKWTWRFNSLVALGVMWFPFYLIYVMIL